jgi:hypothetical protein
MAIAFQVINRSKVFGEGKKIPTERHYGTQKYRSIKPSGIPTFSNNQKNPLRLPKGLPEGILKSKEKLVA